MSDDRVQRQQLLRVFGLWYTRSSKKVKIGKPIWQQLCVHQMLSLQNASTPRAGWQAQHWDWQT